ncbi:hypothetical protein PF003_g15151 [Phytophthora fragariae]|nr:hypothetical protein PF003_g15151 [Phytophthora fragariae]
MCAVYSVNTRSACSSSGLHSAGLGALNLASEHGHLELMV